MAWAPIAIMAIGTVLSVAGQMQASKAAKKQAESQKQAADYEAAQMNQLAGQTQAASQRAAMNERRRAGMIASRGLAVAGASGGGASDPTVVNLLADIEGEGAFRAATALYQGEDKARQYRMGATGKEFEGAVALQGGQARASAYQLSAFGSTLQGAGSLYGKYGMGGPKAGGLATDGGLYGGGAGAGWG